MNIGLGGTRKTILLVDGDAHARAVLRLALETAGFSVGEAATDREGERTVRRIRPDAVLTELALNAGDGNASIVERLRAVGDHTPCYIVSGAAEALVGSIGLHEMGVAGIFLKPVDAGIVIQTLKTRLHADPARSSHA